jgi:hypothetical protein
MAERIDPFAQEEKPPLSRFQPKPPGNPGRPSLTDLEQRPDSGKFISREPVAAPEKPALFRHRTGRNLQFNTRASQHTIERFEALRARLNISKAATMERAIDALERELEGQGT